MYSEVEKADESDTPPIKTVSGVPFVASLFTKLKYSSVAHYKC